MDQELHIYYVYMYVGYRERQYIEIESNNMILCVSHGDRVPIYIYTCNVYLPVIQVRYRPVLDMVTKFLWILSVILSTAPRSALAGLFEFASSPNSS